MNKRVLMAGMAAVSTVIASAAFAQDGSFKDVPNDHWSYAAIEKLTSLNPKVFIGDPDGMFRGKRNLTRYEMAVIIARLLENIDATYARKGAVRDNPPVQPPDLSEYVKRGELAGLSSKADVDSLRKLTGEFQTELGTLGVDVDGVKKRLDALDGRVKKIEDTLAKMPKISGDLSVYGRANGRTGSGNAFGANTLRDQDGFLVTSVRKTPLNDARALHDFNLDITKTVDEKTEMAVRLNFGNYLSYVANSTGNSRGSGANLTQQNTVWKAAVETSAKLPGFGITKLSAGRVPTQFTPYTFKLVDPDIYLDNENTDSGNIPVDGVVGSAMVGRFGVKAIAAKIDPINFISNRAAGRTLNVGATGTSAASFNGPVAIPFNSGQSGQASIEQMAGGQISIPISKFNVSATGLAFGTPNPGSQAYVYGAGVDGKISGFGFVGSYNRSENNIAASREKNEATDLAAMRAFGKLNLTGGYRKIDPRFNAPGSWERLGTYQNPTDIQGYYGKISFGSGDMMAGDGMMMTGDEKMMADGKMMGDGKMMAGHGMMGRPMGKLVASGEYHNYDYLGKTDKITNYRGNVGLSLGGSSMLSVGAEENKLRNSNYKQDFYNAAFTTMLSTATSFKLGYQLLDYKNGSTGLSPKGNVITGQFNVKF